MTTEPNDTNAAKPEGMSRRVLVLGIVALLVGIAGTLGVNRLLSRAPAAPHAASAQYLPPIGTQPLPAPDISLRDQNGQLVSLQALRGKVVLVSFLDPQCRLQCPLLGHELASIEAGLPATIKPVLLVVSVSPGRTAADVTTFLTSQQITWQPGWHWLLGNQAELQAVWATYHVAVQPTANDVTHDVVVYVVNPRGLMVAGYNAPLPIADVTASIVKSAGG